MIIYIKVPDSDIQSDEYLTLHLVPVSLRVIDHGLGFWTAVSSIVSETENDAKKNRNF